MMHQPGHDSFDRIGTMPAVRALSPLEEQVVWLARRDADRGAVDPPRSVLSRLIALLTGVEGVQPLADSRLETLRRYACFSRRGDRRAGQLVADLLGLGFSPQALAGAAAIACA